MYSSIALWWDLHRRRNHRKNCDSERIGHDEEVISSGRVVKTSKASLNSGRADKTSLTNTAEADILVYILDKLRTRMSVKTRDTYRCIFLIHLCMFLYTHIYRYIHRCIKITE